MIGLFEREQRLLLDVPRERLTRLLNYFGSLLVFPLLVALVVGVLGQSVTLGVKTFLLIELEMTVLTPLLDALITSSKSKPHHRRGK